MKYIITILFLSFSLATFAQTEPTDSSITVAIKTKFGEQYIGIIEKENDQYIWLNTQNDNIGIVKIYKPEIVERNNVKGFDTKGLTGIKNLNYKVQGLNTFYIDLIDVGNFWYPGLNYERSLLLTNTRIKLNGKIGLYRYVAETTTFDLGESIVPLIGLSLDVGKENAFIQLNIDRTLGPKDYFKYYDANRFLVGIAGVYRPTKGVYAHIAYRWSYNDVHNPGERFLQRFFGIGAGYVF